MNINIEELHNLRRILKKGIAVAQESLDGRNMDIYQHALDLLESAGVNADAQHTDNI